MIGHWLSTLSVFGRLGEFCSCGTYRGGDGGIGRDSDGGGDGGMGGGDGGGGSEGDGGGGVWKVSVAYLWSFRWRWDAFAVLQWRGLGPLGPKVHLCCYTNTSTKYLSTGTIGIPEHWHQYLSTGTIQTGGASHQTASIHRRNEILCSRHCRQPHVNVQDLVIL